MEKVTQAIQSEGAVLTSQEQRDDVTLKGVKPSIYKINKPNENLSESIYVYIFDSAGDVKKGIEKQKYAVNGITSVKNFEHKNVLVVYFSKGGLGIFDEIIQKALQKL